MKRRWFRDLRTHAKAVVAPLVPAMTSLAAAFGELGSPELAAPLLALADFHARAFAPLPRRGRAFASTVTDAGLLGVALAGLTRTTEPAALARLDEAARLHPGDPRLRAALDRWSRAWPGSAFAGRVVALRESWPEPEARPLDEGARATLARGRALVASLPQRRSVLALLDAHWLRPDDEGVRAVLGDALLELGDIPAPSWLVAAKAPPSGAERRVELTFTLGPGRARGARLAELVALAASSPIHGVRHLDLRHGLEEEATDTVLGLLDAPLLRDLAILSLDARLEQILTAFGRRLVSGARVPVLELRSYARSCWILTDAETLCVRFADTPQEQWLPREVLALTDIAVATGRKSVRLETHDLAALRAIRLAETRVPIVLAEPPL